MTVQASQRNWHRIDPLAPTAKTLPQQSARCSLPVSFYVTQPPASAERGAVQSRLAARIETVADEFEIIFAHGSSDDACPHTNETSQRPHGEIVCVVLGKCEDCLSRVPRLVSRLSQAAIVCSYHARESRNSIPAKPGGPTRSARPQNAIGRLLRSTEPPMGSGAESPRAIERLQHRSHQLVLMRRDLLETVGYERFASSSQQGWFSSFPSLPSTVCEAPTSCTSASLPAVAAKPIMPAECWD